MSAPPTDAPPDRARDDLEAPPRARELVSAALLAVVALVGVVVLPPIGAGAVLLAVSLAYLARRRMFNWTSMLILLAAVIMFIPVRRYAIPLPLPFALEPYRVLLVGLIIAILVALVIDRSFRWRPVVFGWGFAIFIGTQALSIAVNGGTLVEDGHDVGALTALIQFAVLISVMFIVRQLLRGERIVDMLLVFLVWSGVIVAFFAVVERFFRINVFLQLGNFLPLVLLRDDAESLRAGGARAYGSAQHPIALAVLFCLLIPVAIYLAKHAGWPRNEISRKLLYALGIGVMIAGMLVAVSRTGVVVIGVMLLVTLLLRPRLGLVLATLAIPFGVLAAAVVPALFEKTVLSFLDLNSLIASQFASPGYRGQGRLADLGPALAEASQNPFFGTGPGSRIVIGEDANADILDNQWLGTLLESGVVGVAGLAVFILTPIVLLLAFTFRPLAPVGAPRATRARDARPQTLKQAQLGFTIAVATIGYGTAMFFFDAFAFMQAFFVLGILLAVGAWLLTGADRSRRAAL